MNSHAEWSFGTAYKPIPTTTQFAIATIIAMWSSATKTIPNESSVRPIARAGQSRITAHDSRQKIVEVIEHTLTISRQQAEAIIIRMAW
ncbi:MAG TPA: hypothetical protein VGM98_11410 [Schlesneria sp.]